MFGTPRAHARCLCSVRVDYVSLASLRRDKSDLLPSRERPPLDLGAEWVGCAPSPEQIAERKARALEVAEETRLAHALATRRLADERSADRVAKDKERRTVWVDGVPCKMCERCGAFVPEGALLPAPVPPEFANVWHRRPQVAPLVHQGGRVVGRVPVWGRANTPMPKVTYRVGGWEERGKRCLREDQIVCSTCAMGMAPKSPGLQSARDVATMAPRLVKKGSAGQR